MRIFILAIVLTLLGCNSTPHGDDYTQHVNQIEEGYINPSNFTFRFSDVDTVELRGLHSKDDTVEGSDILYAGDAGLVGLLTQVAVHSSIINMQREEKLLKQQTAADESISPLIDMTKDLPLVQLLEEYTSSLTTGNEASINTIYIKPIFFSNSDMNKFSLKTVVWLPTSERLGVTPNNSENFENVEKTERLPEYSRRYESEKYFKYKNMIEVYSRRLTELEKEKLLQGNTEYFSKILSSLLRTTLYIAQNELSGQYAKSNNQNQTHFIEEDSGKRVVRGSLIAEKCGYKIIRDLHSWIIAYPKATPLVEASGEFWAQC